MDNRTFVWGFLIFYIVMAWYIWANNDSIAQIIANDSFKGVFFYFISNISYVAILVTILIVNKQISFIRNTIGALALVLGIDIISFPRLLLSSGSLPKSIDILASSDALVIRHLLQIGISYQTAFTFYYLIFPVILVFVSLELLGFSTFYKTITGRQ